MKNILILILLLTQWTLQAQEVLSPEKLWSFGRISPAGLSFDNKFIVYNVSTPNIENNNFDNKSYVIPVEGGEAREVQSTDMYVPSLKISPDRTMRLDHETVLLENVKGGDRYDDLPGSNVYVYDELHYRHWDRWLEGKYNHVVIHYLDVPEPIKIDVMEGEPYYSPQLPFGGADDYIWAPDSKSVIYVAKKVRGTAYAQSTNTDLYQYFIESKQTVNLTEGMMGYDTHPLFSNTGTLAWLSMARDGYEADKNDLYVLRDGRKVNLTAGWDETIFNYIWANDGETIYFTAPTKGTVQLFSIDSRSPGSVKQITQGRHDVGSLIGQMDSKLYVTRTDMNRAAEIYSIDLNTGAFNQLTNVNTQAYAALKLPKVEERWVKTTDKKDMLVWVIYPPDFDPSKKYPTLLYLQGGPQSPVSQFYSFRWNFQLMASQGYIVVAPNRRGLPGFGTKWNEDISKDWGGQAMKDYLSAIDDVAKESYVDKSRLGAIGASFGGYSAFYLAGIHKNRFKTFISHCGVFNLESMYGTTEELFFVNWDTGGPYWDKGNKNAQKAIKDFNPKNLVDNWNTPILIIQGGKDYRVPVGQGQEAFQAAQVKGLKSRFVYFPDENHWVIKPQNGLAWQREFFGWLNETL